MSPSSEDASDSLNSLLKTLEQLPSQLATSRRASFNILAPPISPTIRQVAHLITMVQGVGSLYDSVGVQYLPLVFPEDCLSHRLLRGFGATPVALPNRPLISKASLFGSLTAKLILSCGRSSRLINTTHRGLLYGDLAYDTTLRLQGSRAICPSVPFLNKHYLYRLWDTLYYLDLFDRLFEGYKPNLVVAYDRSYNIEGSLVRAALHHGIPCLLFWSQTDLALLSSPVDDLTDPRTPSLLHFMKSALAEDLVAAHNYFRRRIAGDPSVDEQAVRAFSPVMPPSSSHAPPMGQSPSQRPTVLIAAHCFIDFPHLTRNQIFLDYYEWLEQTLEFTVSRTDFDWVVREHPMSFQFGETGLVKELCARFQHVRYASSEVSMRDLLQSADAVVTVRGTVGMEATLFGCQVICAGTSIYSALGLATVCSNKQDYFRELSSITKGKQFCQERVDKAALALYFLFELNPVQSMFNNEMGCISTGPALNELEREILRMQLFQKFAQNNRIHDDDIAVRVRNILKGP